MDCCGASPAEESEWQKEEKAAMAMPLEVNGVKLTLGDLFDGYQAKEVAKKIKLIQLGQKSGDADMEDVEEGLFSGSGKQK